MPRGRSANGSGTIRQRKDGRWEAIYTLGRDPGSGKLIRRSVYGATADECAKKLRAATAAIDTGSYMEPSRLLLKDWAETWLNDYCSSIKESTLDTYRKQTRNHVVRGLGAMRLSEIRPHDVQRFVNSMHRGSKDRTALSPKSVKLIFGVLHKMLEQAVKLGYIRDNPANGCSLPRCEKPEIKPLDDDAIGRFLLAVRGHENESLFIVDLFTGMRKSELLGLTWDCIDFDKGTIRLYRQLQYLNGGYSFSTLKNDKTRVLTPSRYVMDALKAQKKKQAAQKLRAGSVWSNKEGFVFTNEAGEHLLHQTIYKRFKRLAAEIGMPEARFHDLRHSYAVAALKNGDDVKTVQEHLGHHTAAFTLDQYGHVTDQMRKESAVRMDAAIESILQKAGS